MIKLTGDTISKEDIDELILWLQKYGQLTMGEQTVKFENEFAEWINAKHCVMVNSGSSANLIMLYTLIQNKTLKNNKVVCPTISWNTTIAPIIQFGLQPIICDWDKDTLGCDIESLKEILYVEKPAAIIVTNILGFHNKQQVYDLCEDNDVVVICDNCETMGSMMNGRKWHGLMSSFSCYYSHIISCAETGLVVTDDDDLYETLLMLRSHGWSRSLSKERQKYYKDKYNVSDFDNMYTFYMPGFNVRPTDIQATIGLSQMNKINNFCSIRQYNFNLFQQLISNNYWKPKPIGEFVVNMSYPVISPLRDKIVKELIANEIECRPLVSGSMSKQPFIKDKRIKCYDKNADIIDKFGFYVPNHPDIEVKDIIKISEVINGVIAS
jgi:CDP-6-deoxy-D-xylo-4-hexulose-3-dehydrase